MSRAKESTSRLSATRNNKVKSTPKPKPKPTVTKCNCPPGFECRPKPKTRSKIKIIKSKIEPVNNNNALSNTIGESKPASSNLGFHPRGLINNEPQQ